MTTVRAVRWTVRAQRELDLIQKQIAIDAPQAAEKMRHRLVEATDSLAAFPDIGRTHGETRLLVTVRPYVIRYRVRPEAVVIPRDSPWGSHTPLNPNGTNRALAARRPSPHRPCALYPNCLA